MKKLNITLSIILGLLLIVSCDSDRDSNPTVQVPESFVLNTPPYASSTVDLMNTISFELTTSQPDYGFTAPVVYSVQISLENTWVDATEDTDATYRTLETIYTSTKIGAVASEAARNIVSLAGWTNESDVPDDAISVYIRLKAHLSADAYPVYSNSVELFMLPYFILLKDALPAPYYLLGAPIGDGNWTNSAAGIGVSMIPMALVRDAEYDKTTGKGEFIYTGYFPAGQGFKIVGIVGSWDEQWGNGGSAGINDLVHNDGGSNDLSVPTDGWYTISLNSVENTLTIEKTDINPGRVATMELVGDFNNWGNDGIAPLVLTKSGGEDSHVWYGTVTFAEDGGCKFRTDSSWSQSWGGDAFPSAKTTSNNIPVVAGTYTIVFNDLDECYYFIEETE